MTSKYLVGGGSTVKPDTRSPAMVIVDGVTTLEKTIAELRREQSAIWDQMQRQREWLGQNEDHELYEQRQGIYQDRRAQWQDIEERANGLLDLQQQRIDSLEGRDKELAIMRLLSWSEAPFILAIALAVAS